MRKYNYEPNPVHHFFPYGTSCYEAVRIVREGFMDNVARRVNSSLIDGAKQEVITKRLALDSATSPIAEAMARNFLGENTRVVMLVDGVFYDDSKTENYLESVIPLELTNSRHVLFGYKGIPKNNTTIDSYVTEGQTQQFLDEHQHDFKKVGYNTFRLRKSLFFYFKENDIEQFLSNGAIDMFRLAPLLNATNYVGLEKVAKPSLGEYLNLAPTHLSYRLKQTLYDKLIRFLMLEQGSIREESDRNGKLIREWKVITDWVAYRFVVATLKQAYDLEAELRGLSKIGRFSMRHLYTKDDYLDNESEDDVFKALFFIAEFSRGGFVPSVREIQLVDKRQNYKNDLEGGRTSRPAYERKKGYVPADKKRAHEHFEHILFEIFGEREKVLRIGK